MPTLDDIVAGVKDKSKQQLQDALLELLKGNPDILDTVTKSTTGTRSEVVSVFVTKCLNDLVIFADEVFVKMNVK